MSIAPHCPICGPIPQEFKPIPPDPLAKFATLRDVLDVLAVVDPLAWERFTVQWRQEARSQALTQVDHGHEHPTREDR